MREFFRSSFQLADPPAEDGTFRGYAAVFNTPIDTWMPTVIQPGAFTKTLQENAARVRILYQHDSWRLIGKPVSMAETTIGLEVVGKISDTDCGREVLQLMRDGVLTDLSIGFDTVKAQVQEREGQEPLRIIQEVRLWEFSPVTWGANAPAQITEVNAALRRSYVDMGRHGNLPQYLQPWFQHVERSERIDQRHHDRPEQAAHSAESEQHGATPFGNLPLAARDRAWSRSDATKAVQKWASSDGSGDKETIDWPKFRKAFFWYDAADAENFGAYKLMFADMVDGALTAVPRGVFACAGVMMGARGGVDMPEADMPRVKAAVEKYYAKMAKEFDDEDIVAPWAMMDEERARLRIEPLLACVIDETHEGKVLSAKNKRLVQDARDALQALLDAAEPPAPAEDEQALTERRNKHRAAMDQLREAELLAAA